MLSLHGSSPPGLPFESPVHWHHPSFFLSMHPCHYPANPYIDSHSLWDFPSLTILDQLPCVAYSGWALGGFNKLFSDRLLVPNCFTAAVFHLEWGERACNSSCMHAIHFVFKVHIVGPATLKEMSIICRVGGRVVILWEPLS